MKFATVVAVALLSGCTTNNPNYVGDGDGGSDLAGLHLDGASGDLAAERGDLAMAGSCTDGERRCGTGRSEICINGSFIVNRVCPSMSMCHEGYCQPPPASTASELGADCAMATFLGDGPQENQCLQSLADNLSCEPFFDQGTIVWRCDKIVGAGFPGTACTDGSQCRSGFCGSNGTCFRACQGDQDCPQNGGVTLFCNDVTIVVEGMSVTTGSCTP